MLGIFSRRFTGNSPRSTITVVLGDDLSAPWGVLFNDTPGGTLACCAFGIEGVLS